MTVVIIIYKTRKKERKKERNIDRKNMVKIAVTEEG
jgi:hypothetical protein